MFVGPKSPTMQSVQLSAFLMLGVFIIIATSSSDLQKSTEKENNCPTCGAAGVNGLPGRDARDGPKGEKRDLGLQGPQGPQGVPVKEGPAGLKGDKRSAGTKGKKGSSEGDGPQGVPVKEGPADLKGEKDSAGTKGEKGSSEGDGQQSVQSMIEKLTILQDNFNKLKNALIFTIGKEVGSKLYVTNGLQYEYWTARNICFRDKGQIAAPRTADENDVLQEIVLKHQKKAFLGMTDIGMEGTFQYSLGEEITYANWDENEPNNAHGDENCIELEYDGKWNDVSCSKQKLLICEF
uniref:Pulmonary surfactant-associated protein D-like n=1 Tax=Geotrypetes seraphini TaxID=260995 RepID=A0A6P8QSI3_GEOSA|nr:pulmonary surfactant-associated protein D-like [Geotrypetes seraphini]